MTASKVLKSVFSNLGLVAVLTSSIGMLGWWWDVKFNERMAPISQDIKAISTQLTNFESYQETLRKEVKSIAETKVDKDEFRDVVDQMDNRMDTIEMGQDLHNHYSHPKVEKSQ